MLLFLLMGSTQNIYSQINFTEVAHLDDSRIPFTKDGGCSFADFDLDGDFAPLTTFNELASASIKGAVLTGGFDNDGDFDILRKSELTDSNRATIHKNTGDNSMVFNLVSNPFLQENGFVYNSTNTEGATLRDIDHDGDLDIFISRRAFERDQILKIIIR